MPIIRATDTAILPQTDAHSELSSTTSAAAPASSGVSDSFSSVSPNHTSPSAPVVSTSSSSTATASETAMPAHRLRAALASGQSDAFMRQPLASLDPLSAVYGQNIQVPRSYERVLVQISKVHSGLAGLVDAHTSVDKTTDKVISSDLRRQIFLLEGILKLYRKRFGPEVEKHFIVAKELEDVIGEYTHRRSLTQKVEEYGAPGKVVKYMQKHESAALKNLRDLVSEKWTPKGSGDARSPALAAMMDDLCQLDWDGDVADSTYIRKEISRRLTKMTKKDYQMDNLDDGVHELRRQLRWFAIYAEALDGMIVLDPSLHPSPEYESALKDPLATSRFVELTPPSRESVPLHLSKSLYTRNMRAVFDLGDIKDEGEYIVGIKEAYLESGSVDSKKSARKKTRKLLGYDVKRPIRELYAKADSYNKELMSLDHVRHLIDALA